MEIKAFAEEWGRNNDTLFIFWFEETLQRVLDELNQSSSGPFQLFMAREIAKMHITGKPVVIAEHYPLAEKENELYKKLDLKEVKVWSALDEPLFHRFGGEKIIQLMRQLGMKEEEPVEHNMISKAIRNAQEKIASKITVEQSARSQQDWLAKNFPA